MEKFNKVMSFLVGSFCIIIFFASYRGMHEEESRYPELYKKTIWIDMPTFEKLEELLVPITISTTQHIDKKDHFKKIGSSISISIKYTNPTQETVDKVFGNIKKQNLWELVNPPEPTEDYKTFRHHFCYGEYSLIVSDHIHTPNIFENTQNTNFVIYLFWNQSSFCRKKAIYRSN
ncbi:MAG: hypothetical protein Q4B81_04310 [Moraxella sp.]|nr:hypothetical protein [Moraxella sp.]